MKAWLAKNESESVTNPSKDISEHDANLLAAAKVEASRRAELRRCVSSVQAALIPPGFPGVKLRACASLLEVRLCSFVYFPIALAFCRCWKGWARFRATFVQCTPKLNMPFAISSCSAHPSQIILDMVLYDLHVAAEALRARG